MKNQFVKIFTYNDNQVVVKKESAPNNSIIHIEMRPKDSRPVEASVKFVSKKQRDIHFDAMKASILHNYIENALNENNE